MTPKEKAKELIESFAETIPAKIFGVLMERDWQTAKQCALMAADYLIKYLPSSDGNPPNLQENEYDREWWMKVKEEIDKT